MFEQPLRPKVVTAQEGPTYRVVSDLMTFKVRAADTNGVYSLFETRTPPGQGTPPHRQWYEDETFWVIEGIYTLLLDEHEVMLQAGDCAFVPRGTLHAYTNSGDTPARMLILVTPGGIQERFLAEAGYLIDGETVLPAPSDITRLLRVAPKYGIEIRSPSPDGETR